jgi:hypothetical protein
LQDLSPPDADEEVNPQLDPELLRQASEAAEKASRHRLETDDDSEAAYDDLQESGPEEDDAEGDVAETEDEAMPLDSGDESGSGDDSDEEGTVVDSDATLSD